MKFFSRSNRPPLYTSTSGGKTTPKYGLELNNNGQEVLSIIGEEPIYEKIQASTVGTNISELILRWRAGDDSVLDQAHGVFGDFTDIPSDLASSQRAIMKVQSFFNSLPLSEREKYNMNFSAYLSDMVNQTSVPSAPAAPAALAVPAAPAVPADTITVDGKTYKFVQEEIKI